MVNTGEVVGLIKALGASGGGGSGGTSDYTDLSNKPQINSVTLSGNLSLSDLGIAGTDWVATEEASSTAAAAHAAKTVFRYNNKLYMATAAIAVGDTIVTSGTGQNVVEVTLADAFPHDVQVNGTSVVTDGVANVPLASSSVPGVAKTDTYSQNYAGGVCIANGKLYVVGASETKIKQGVDFGAPLSAGRQHNSVFYGLAKASGDSTQSASNNAVGTYTEGAKSAISQMLDAPETVSGSTPSITAKPGVRYICGECSTLTITVPESGCIDIVFESGSTATVLTLTPTKTGVSAIKFPSWFDPDDLEANKTYELNILDGEYGVVTSWA